MSKSGNYQRRVFLKTRASIAPPPTSKKPTYGHSDIPQSDYPVAGAISPKCELFGPYSATDLATMLTSRPTTLGSNMSPSSSANLVKPTTPKSQSQQPSAVDTPSPGTWQHPKFDEITRRQKASTFDDNNLRKVAFNGAALLALLYGSSHPPISILLSHTPLRPLTTPLLLFLTLIFLYNILTALLPLTRPKDNLSDIPLTPTQRALLGLDPNATPPPPPGTTYITPPRYPRSPTPRNVSPVGSAGFGTPMSRRGGSNSSSRNGTPSSSPLWGKSTGPRDGMMRRYSSGTPSPLGPSIGGLDRSVLGTSPGTPSPLAGRGASVALNSKWLYERGRSSSSGGGRSIYS